jgi:hypothetical protein
VQLGVMKKLNMKRRSVALPPALDAFISALAKERGVEASEIMREAFFEYKERRDRLIPRQGRQRPPPVGQSRMPLSNDAA